MSFDTPPSLETWRTPTPRNWAALWPYGISAGLHLTALLAFLIWPASPVVAPPTPAPIKVSIVSLPPKTPAKPVPDAPVAKTPTAPQAPQPETAPEPKPVAQRPAVKAPVKTAAKPPVTHVPTKPVTRPQARPTEMPVKPTPTPTPPPNQVTILRKYRDFDSLTDEQLRQLELPPGLKNWDEFAKLAKDIGMFKAAVPPPTTTNGNSAPDGLPNSDPVWSWREEGDEQIGLVTWWGGRATISWRPGDHKATGEIIPEIPSPSPVPYDVAIGLGSDRESVAAAVIQVLRAFNADGDPSFRPFPPPTPAPVDVP